MYEDFLSHMCRILKDHILWRVDGLDGSLGIYILTSSKVEWWYTKV